MRPELPEYKNSTETFQVNCKSVGINNIEAKILNKRQSISQKDGLPSASCSFFKPIFTILSIILCGLEVRLVTITHLVSHLLLKSSNKYFLNMYNVSGIIPGTGEYSSDQNRTNFCSSGTYLLLGKQTIKKSYM